ncbi:MAG: hypothetical protein RLZZ282_542 [Verrucomicrobiota bacterium]
MTTESNQTYFASALRTEDNHIEFERRIIERNPIILELLEGFPDMALLLDSNRQIVAFNSKAVSYVPEKLRGCIYGKRPGEAIACIHAHEMPAGCGTSKFCVECGAVKSSVSTITKSEPAIEECRITRHNDTVEESLDLSIQTSPITIEGCRFILFSIKDIADEKRRAVLERIFFHDVINTAGALDGLIGLLPECDGDDLTEIEGMLPKVSSQLLNEITSQRELLSAEAGVLVPAITILSLNTILHAAGILYTGHDVARGKSISVSSLPNDVTFESDEMLLIRSLGNLIKNALEASADGDTIKVSAEATEQEILIHVWNNTVMPQSVQVQMFQRSFSTKAAQGRGIGTYSVKLLVDQYLKGKITFRSNESEKTIFTIILTR